MHNAVFVCSVAECGEKVNVSIDKGRAFEPLRCDACGQAGSYALKHNFCAFGTKQYVKLQETPESIPAGETPQCIQLYLFDQMYDCMRPGDRVEVTGILRGASQRTAWNLRWGSVLFCSMEFVEGREGSWWVYRGWAGLRGASQFPGCGPVNPWSGLSGGPRRPKRIIGGRRQGRGGVGSWGGSV